MNSRGPTRILHLLEAMGPGGIETWLMHVLRRIDRERFHMDFVVQTTKKAAYDDEIQEFGSRIFRCSHRRRPVNHDRDFRRILRDQGPYDIIHGHLHYYNGYALRRARQAGIPVRIAHSHNDSPLFERGITPRKMYASLMGRWISRDATVGLACSREAARALFGPAWEADPRLRILYYGIDLEPFRDVVDPATARAELGIPADAFVVGHVGRFFKQKNHEFLVDIASEVIKREPKACLLMVGGYGSLRSSIERRVAQAGIKDRAIFAGVRKDVPRLMLGAMDAFVLPSFYEGLPLVGIEAQSAGLPFVLSDVISKEMDVVHPLIHRLSLSQPASVWAETILAARNAKPVQQDAFRLMEESHFNIDSSVRELERVYARQA